MSWRSSPILDAGVPQETLTRLGSLMEAESRSYPDVMEHAVRVSEMSVRLAASIGIGGRDLDLIALSSRLHDVGKMFIDRNVLTKPARLTADEFREMKRHAELGATILAALEGLPRQVVDVAAYHHERFDGAGYVGVVGEDIPLAARIVAIADVHDALVSRREYKAGLPEAKVLLMMTADNPSPSFGRRAFDPALLRSFVQMRLPEISADIEARAELEGYLQSAPAPDFPQELGRPTL